MECHSNVNVVGTEGGVMTKFIEQNTTVPNKKQTFTTRVDSQQGVFGTDV